MVAALSVLAAVSAFLGTRAQLSGDDADLESQNALVLASTSYLEANQIAVIDAAQYEAYQLSKDSDAEAAQTFLEAGSTELREGMLRVGGPFDAQYLQVIYQSAEDYFAEAAELQEQGNRADDQALAYELALLVFALGLAMTGWASLADARPRIARTFIVFGFFALVAGLGTFVWAGSL